MYGVKILYENGSIPLSSNTVARRIDEMSEWVENQIIRRIQVSGLFALQLDELTDVQGLFQLIVVIRFIYGTTRLLKTYYFVNQSFEELAK